MSEAPSHATLSFAIPLVTAARAPPSVAAVEKLSATHRATPAEVDAPFASFQHRVFRGEL